MQGTSLHIRQGLNAKQQLDLTQIKASILEDVFSNKGEADTIPATMPVAAVADTAVLAELKILYPAVRSFGLSTMVVHRADAIKADTLKVAVANFPAPLRRTDQQKLQSWLRTRYGQPSLKLILE